MHTFYVSMIFFSCVEHTLYANATILFAKHHRHYLVLFPEERDWGDIGKELNYTFT